MSGHRRVLVSMLAVDLTLLGSAIWVLQGAWLSCAVISQLVAVATSGLGLTRSQWSPEGWKGLLLTKVISYGPTLACLEVAAMDALFHVQPPI